MNPNWVVRPIELQDGDGPDVDLAFVVIAAHEIALGHPTEETRESVRGSLAGSECDLEHSLLVLDPPGAPLGHLRIEVDDHAHEIWVDAYADPTAGRAVLDPLVHVGVARAREIAAERGGTWSARTGHYGEDNAYAAALAQEGFTPIRHFQRMRVDFDSPPAPAPDWPADATLEESGGTDEAQRAVYDVLEDAFADHWNHTRKPFDDWLEWATSPIEFFDPTLWWLVRVDGTPAAALLGTRARDHLGDGYVRLLGVRREFRGRGLARGMLLRYFGHSAERGMRGTHLGVDSESPTGAVRLYESVGMIPVRHIVANALDISASA